MKTALLFETAALIAVISGAYHFMSGFSAGMGRAFGYPSGGKPFGAYAGYAIAIVGAGIFNLIAR